MRFELLNPGQLELLSPYFQRQELPLSAYSLASLMAWRDCEGFEVAYALHRDAVVVRARNPKQPQEDHLILPVPADRFGPAELLELVRAADLKSIWYVPESYLQRHGEAGIALHFDCVEQGGFEDYVYRTTDLAELKGNRFSKKRNLIRQFEDAFVLPGRVKIESITPAVTGECRVFLERWCEEHDCAGEDKPLLTCEINAVIHTFEDFTRLPVEGLLIRIDGAVCGFGVATRLNPQMGVLHFEKADPQHKGLYQYLDRECARVLFAGKSELINKESDLGLPGLRQAKQSYHPVSRIKSYALKAR
jgi:uncharacterized protein